MKTIIILVFLTHSNLFSQDVIKKYDKYENKFYLSLENELSLFISDINETLTFDLNIIKIYNSQDTSYYLRIEAKYKYKLLCSTVETKCIINYAKDKSIILKPSNSEYDRNKFGTDIYNFDFPIQKNELLDLLIQKKIKILINCSDGELQGDFSEDNFEDFRKFIINYVK